MNDTTWTCDRCNNLNDISDVRIIEHAQDICEIVCNPCMKDEKRDWEQSLFDSYSDEI